jgi:hypothetical protein
MIPLLDNLLRQVLMQGVAGLQAAPVVLPPPAAPVTHAPVIADQVGFRAPDEQWAQDVENLQLNALNVYLVDLRENRRLRSNEREHHFENGLSYTEVAPARIDCHYLISAWSSAKYITPTVEPVRDEHALLYETAAVLIRSGALNPSQLYPPSPSPIDDWPTQFQTIDLPIVVSPPEGFVKLAEFWGTMGTGHRWKPSIYLIVTLPVECARELSGPMVTTRITEYRQSGIAGSAEVWIQIGGTVYDKAGAAVSGAWVGLETTTAEPLLTTTTNEKGRFTFGNLRTGTYVLRVRAVALGELIPTRQIEVPSPTGEYDLHYH